MKEKDESRLDFWPAFSPFVSLDSLDFFPPSSATSLVSSLGAVSCDSVLIAWARRMVRCAPPSPLAPRPGQSPCNSCALRCRLGIVDRPRPPSIMLLMYIVFSPTLPPPSFAAPLLFFSRRAYSLSLSRVFPHKRIYPSCPDASLPASIVVSSLRSDNARTFSLSLSIYLSICLSLVFSSSTHRHFLLWPFRRSTVPRFSPFLFCFS